MSKYDFNINNAATESLPPDKRYQKNVTFIQSLLSALQWVYNLFFKSYYEGSTASVYAPGTYNYLDQVRYQKKIYLSLINDNTDLPTTLNWVLIQDNFIGMKERILYNGSKLVLEYALNKQFDATFRQLPSTSDIYISNLPVSTEGFLVGQTIGSSVGQTLSSGTIGRSIPFIYLNNFQISIPIAIFALTNEQAVRNFVNQYVPAGLNYLIVTI